MQACSSIIVRDFFISQSVNGTHSSLHLRFCVDVVDETVLNIGLTMSPEARAMVDFFIQAEACNNVKYHQAIPTY